MNIYEPIIIPRFELNMVYSNQILIDSNINYLTKILFILLKYLFYDKVICYLKHMIVLIYNVRIM